MHEWIVCRVSQQNTIMEGTLLEALFASGFTMELVFEGGRVSDKKIRVAHSERHALLMFFLKNTHLAKDYYECTRGA